jgi:hypothetical protein
LKDEDEDDLGYDLVEKKCMAPLLLDNDDVRAATTATILRGTTAALIIIPTWPPPPLITTLRDRRCCRCWYSKVRIKVRQIGEPNGLVSMRMVDDESCIEDTSPQKRPRSHFRTVSNDFDAAIF